MQPATTSRGAAPGPPPFTRLLRCGLRSVGISYVPMELLRQAKRQAVAEQRDYMVLWKLLHDVLLVVLMDFEVDVEAMERENDAARLDEALRDPEAHAIRVELVRYYLFEWGFTCRAFFEDTPRAPPSSVLLVALAWLLAHSRFFERQHPAILEHYLNSARVPLPPYPDDVLTARETAERLAARVRQDAQAVESARLDVQGDPAAASAVHQAQALFGRLESVLRALESYERYHSRLLAHVKALSPPRDEGAEPEDAVPVYAVRLLSCGSPEEVELHVRALAERVQMVADEKSFYKWVNGIVSQIKEPCEAPLSAALHRLSIVDDALGAAVEAADASCQAIETLRKQIAQRFAVEWKKWKQSTASRAKIQKMETKMQQLEQEILSRELPDPSSLFLAERSTTSEGKQPAAAENSDTDTDADARLAARRKDLETVMNEIVSTYCLAQWV
ncbi:hypothetical protein P43SY_007304 [Pythium insidiosum]|uniref:Tubulin epsilon and delta complex protein 1 domain-containing protein n=1 Tax=Pythium insidiosum TaxID=114742 RepID=A0AAD5Q9P3_PYTIN|nr:hypothetical protein P43SY_007304 [Pythium insidiosum]